MPWDMFCPECKSTLVGDMVDDEQGMLDSQAEYKDSVIYCSGCNSYIDFNSGERIDLISYLYNLFNKRGAISEIRIVSGG